MKTIKQMNNMKLKLDYGNPMISRLEQTDEMFYLNVVIPAVVDGEMSVVLDDGKVNVEHEIDGALIGKFRFSVYAEDVNFKEAHVEKQYGVLYLGAPLHQPTKSNPKTLTV